MIHCLQFVIYCVLKNNFPKNYMTLNYISHFL
jgi:hypothetical protein